MAGSTAQLEIRRLRQALHGCLDLIEAMQPNLFKHFETVKFAQEVMKPKVRKHDTARNEDRLLLSLQHSRNVPSDKTELVVPGMRKNSVLQKKGN